MPRAPLSAQFLADLPQSAAARELAVLFEQGNYDALRARVLALPKDDSELQRVGQLLLSRTRPEPAVLWLLALAGLLLVAVTVFAYGRG